jgi:hypothetical protein
MRTRNLTIIAVTLLTAVALALPAAAAPPEGKGKKQEVDLVDVTMNVVGTEGLATSCDDADGISGSLRMQRDANSITSVEGVAPILELHMGEIEWSRDYPDEASGTGFAECHGGTVAGSPGEWEGLLMIGLDSAGEPDSITWHFDYYVESTTVERGKKTQERATIREHFTLSGPLTWDADTSTASGTLQIAYYFNDYENDPVLYEPFDGNPRPMSFTMTIEPAA